MMDDLRRNTQILSGLVDQSDHLLHTSLLVDVLAYREKLSSKINQNHSTGNYDHTQDIKSKFHNLTMTMKCTLSYRMYNGI